MSDNNNNNGIGFFGLLTILFVGLKLTGHIAWSWWWVLSPTLIPLGIVGVFLLGLFVVWLATK
jgi:hypothetical protein